MSAFIEIMDKNGQWFSFSDENAASEYEPVWNDIVDADRAVDGTLRYEGIVDKDKIVVTWNLMPPDTYRKLYAMTSLRIFRMRYFAPKTGGIRTSNFYLGSDQKLTCMGQWKGDRFVGYKVSASFVEE